MDIGSFFVLILIIGALYYLSRRRRHKTRELMRSLQAGDEVVTNTGIHGVVAEVEDAVVWLEVAPDIELKISLDAIAGRAPAASAADYAGGYDYADQEQVDGAEGQEQAAVDGAEDDRSNLTLLLIASLVRPVASVSGPGSPEWRRATAFLEAVSDGKLKPSSASVYLSRAYELPDLAYWLMPHDLRLSVLRFSIEIAAADGDISPDEWIALREVSSKLELPWDIVERLAQVLIGEDDETIKALRSLGLNKGATTADIRNARRHLIDRWHPDRHPESSRAEATARAAKINAAYDHLMAGNS